ncbi:MAG: TonB-dependent receptor plug domain-containing protein, partial [Deltaproteobacteria bacterium]|nr:TonB-dependent receptor plug domain-containing protein [Deltaproteobacteria bacterium]
MRAESYRDNELVGLYAPPKDEITRRTLSIEEVRRIPGTFGDPVKVIQTLPGAARSPFGTGLLVIRGSNPEDSGVYIDGTRIPLIYHLTGTTSVIAPDLVEAVDYLPGGYGVQYGRSMGGVVDVRTRRSFSDDPKLVWGTDILDSNLYFEGKVGKKDGKKHGIAIGARRSYIDVFLPLVVPGDYVFKPRYWDYQVKWVLPTDADRTTSLFVYGFDDVLEIGTPDSVAQGSDADTQGDLRTQYNSHRVIFQLERDLGEKLTFRLTPALGRDTTFFGLGSEFLLDNSNVLGTVRTELAWQASPAVEVVPGLDMLGAYWAFTFESAIRFTDLDDPLAEREGIGFDGHGTIWSPDPFLRVNLRPLDDREKWLVTPGIRANLVTTIAAGEITGSSEALPPDTIFSVDPRIATRYRISDPVTVKGVVGLYHQPPQPQEILGVGTASTVSYERALTSSVGVEHRLSQAIHYDLEVFYKDMRDLLIFDEAWTGLGSNPYLNGGDGRAYGLEVILRHEPVNRLFGWVSYTLSRAARRDSDDCADVGVEPDAGAAGDLLGYGPCWYRFDFDQTHILSAQGGYDLPKDFGISAQVQFVTGNPTTFQDAGVYDADGGFYTGFATSDYNDQRLPPFFQTSLRFDKLFTFKRWQLETYVDLINVVRGVNPEFTLSAYDYSDQAFVRGLPFIPNVGIEAKFWP